MLPEAIERIEVVRGPMSSLYGLGTLGGVVNVIIRRATDAWHGSLSAQGGLMEGAGGDSRQIGAYAGGPLVSGVLGLSVAGPGLWQVQGVVDQRMAMPAGVPPAGRSAGRFAVFAKP